MSISNKWHEKVFSFSPQQKYCPGKYNKTYFSAANISAIADCHSEFPSFGAEGKDKKLVISNKILLTNAFYHNNAAHSDYQFKFC